MILDTSAVIAVMRNETDAASFARAMERADVLQMSAANYVEAAAVIDGSRDPIASRRFDEFMREARILMEPVTAAQAELARAAYRDFGKGSGHPARLNFGDCFAYALAKARNGALLFKGDDFVQTDVSVADRD